MGCFLRICLQTTPKCQKNQLLAKPLWRPINVPLCPINFTAWWFNVTESRFLILEDPHGFFLLVRCWVRWDFLLKIQLQCLQTCLPLSLCNSSSTSSLSFGQLSNRCKNQITYKKFRSSRYITIYYENILNLVFKHCRKNMFICSIKEPWEIDTVVHDCLLLKCWSD